MSSTTTPAFNLINANSHIPKYRQVVNLMLWEIEQGTYRPGDRVLSINRMSEECDLSRDTVEKAYRELSLRGILTSIPGKGFFITKNMALASLRVMVLFDQLAYPQEQLYQAIVNPLGDRAITTLSVYQQDLRQFQHMVMDNLGLFDYYLILPRFGADTDRFLAFVEKIPANRLILLQQDLPLKQEGYGLVWQEASGDLYRALGELKARFRPYRRLKHVQPAAGCPYPGPELKAGLAQFAQEAQLLLESGSYADLSPLCPGDVYLVSDEAALCQLLQASRQLGLRPGQDWGLISLVDSPLMEGIMGGVTTFAPDYQQWGQAVARMILTGKREQVHLPAHITLRASL